MSFDRCFKLSSFCLIASGFIAIAATGSIDSFSLLTFGFVLVAGWFVDTARLQRIVPRWAQNAAALMALPIYLVDYELLSRSFFLSIIHVIFYVAALRVLTRSSDRDYVYLYLLSFAELVGASALTVDFTFVLAFALFLVSGVSTLVLLEMKRSNAQNRNPDKVHSLGAELAAEGPARTTQMAAFPVSAFAALSLTLTLMILFLAVPLFVLLPRVSLGMYRRPGGPTRLLSGFTERVELGMIGTIKKSDKVVMRVKLGDSGFTVPGSIKWRGIALDHYDGRAWSRSDRHRQFLFIQPQDRFGPAGGEYFQFDTSVLSPKILEQTFFLEALSTDVIFASHRVKAISRDVGFLQQDTSGNLFSFTHPYSRLRYKAMSDLTPPDPSLVVLRPDLIPDRVRSCCLQLPREDARIAELAFEVTKDVTNPFEKSRALESYLAGHYAYSLELSGTARSEDPLSMFLFDVRRGHCEYFATAMAIMLRMIGIPSRLVNGFRAGEFNRVAGDWTVHEYDAHSWVEAYLPPYGWIEFDPTPPDPSLEKTGISGAVSHLIDAFDLLWFENVVNYDIWKQIRLIDGIRSRAVVIEGRASQFFASFWSWCRSFGDGVDRFNRPHSSVLISALITVLSAGLLYIGIRRKRWDATMLNSLRRALHRNNHRIAINSFYSEALALLSTRGFSRLPSQTFLEFAQSLGEHPAKAPFEALTRIYNRIRFGHSLEAEDSLEAADLMKSLRRQLEVARQ